MNILYLTFLLNGLLMIAIPIALGAYLVRKLKLSWRLFFIGSAVFVLSQVFHIPFNALLNIPFQRGWLPVPSTEWRLPFNAIVGGLSAGIFEEGARALMYLYWTKKERWWGEGILLGAGHGGIEAIILGLLVLLTYLNMVALRGMDTSALTNIQAQAVQKYWSMPVPLSLFGALERMLAIPIQISLSVLVLQAFIRRQPGWIILAVVWHALVDAVAIYLAVTAGAYATEGVIAVLAISALAIVYAFRQPRPIEQHPEPVSLTPVDLSTLQVRESLENLEKTRYQE